MYVVSSLTGTSEGGPDFPMCTLVLFFFCILYVQRDCACEVRSAREFVQVSSQSQTAGGSWVTREKCGVLEKSTKLKPGAWDRSLLPLLVVFVGLCLLGGFLLSLGSLSQSRGASCRVTEWNMKVCVYLSACSAQISDV